MSTSGGADGPPQRPSSSNSQSNPSREPASTSQDDQPSSRPISASLAPQPAQSTTAATTTLTPAQEIAQQVHQRAIATTSPSSSRPTSSSLQLPGGSAAQQQQGASNSSSSRRPSLGSGVRQPSIRLRRSWAPGPGSPLPSPSPAAGDGGRTSYFGPVLSAGQQQPPSGATTTTATTAAGGRRARSSSDPPGLFGPPLSASSVQPSTAAGSGSTGGAAAASGIPSTNVLTQMPTLVEEVSDTTGPRAHTVQTMPSEVGGEGNLSSDYTASVAESAPAGLEDYDLDSHLVDVLDVVDPEVSTLTTLTNMQNSLFVPNLGRLISRRPVYTLTPTPTRLTAEPTRVTPDVGQIEPETSEDQPPLTHTSTITSTMSASRYAVLPHGKRLEDWTADEKDELNDHVRHMLHSRRSKFKRAMKGFWQYVRKPLGFFVTVYATLITLFGLAWVLFLIGWINVGEKKLYVINVIDNVLVALFAIMGDGLAPFRAWDTYNMIPIAYYHHKTWKIRKQQALPKLANKNDLPTLREEDVGVEESKEGYYVVLNEKDQASLQKHIERYQKSHTFYKPHETQTHYAFPIAYMIAIQILLDCHSMLQISLGTCTWAISYHVRPFALTTVILCCSITSNITAGVLITLGDHKTRKKDVIERMNRQELTSEAIEKLEKKKRKERERNEELEKEASGSGQDSPNGKMSPELSKVNGNEIHDGVNAVDHAEIK